MDELSLVAGQFQFFDFFRVQVTHPEHIFNEEVWPTVPAFEQSFLVIEAVILLGDGACQFFHWLG